MGRYSNGGSKWKGSFADAVLNESVVKRVMLAFAAFLVGSYADANELQLIQVNDLWAWSFKLLVLGIVGIMGLLYALLISRREDARVRGTSGANDTASSLSRLTVTAFLLSLVISLLVIGTDASSHFSAYRIEAGLLMIDVVLIIVGLLGLVRSEFGRWPSSDAG